VKALLTATGVSEMFLLERRLGGFLQMGHSFKATCNDCRLEFEGNDGGGFFFHLLRCEWCGENKAVGFDEIGEPHLHYLKGLPGPYCIASSETDEVIRESFTLEPITEEQYHKAVESLAGKCQCDGQFRFNAPVRCPRCRSSRIEKGETLLMYD
jgi:hypothetical protein